MIDDTSVGAPKRVKNRLAVFEHVSTKTESSDSFEATHFGNFDEAVGADVGDLVIDDQVPVCDRIGYDNNSKSWRNIICVR